MVQPRNICCPSSPSSSPMHKRPVTNQEYDAEWIRETWGWDTPENFIKTQGKNLRPRILESLKLANLKPGMRILDIGCSRGEVVMHCARMGINAVGIDYSQQALDIAEKAKATHTKEEQTRMHFIYDDVKNLKLDERFDRIFMLDLVEHLHDWELLDLFECCHRLLTSDGILIIHTLPNKWVYEVAYRRLMRIFMPWLPKNPRSEKEMAIHVNEMTITHLYRILKHSNFKSRVWLQDLIIEQARWHRRQPLADRRGLIYRWLANPVICLIYKILAKTPLRLLIVNEIFAVAWNPETPLPIKVPAALTERLIIRLGRN